MAGFNVPNLREEAANAPIPLPEQLPADMLELPPIDSSSENLCKYLARNGRWSFEEHLKNLPKHGTGELHRAIYLAVVAGLAEGLLSTEVHYLVMEKAKRKGRPSHQANKEVADSLINAHRWLSGVDVGMKSGKVPKDRLIQWGDIWGIASGPHTLDTLQEASGEIPQDQEAVLRKLFHPHEYICCATEMHDAQTHPLGTWLGSDMKQVRLIVPNPMSKPWGISQNGRQSARCLDNTRPRKYLVVEFDFKEGKCEQCDALLKNLGQMGRSVRDMNAALHSHLQQYLPLAMVVFSGSESLHGWYPCQGIPEEQLGEFQNYAHSLGADPQLFVPCQLTRMPWGTRDNGVIQSVVYFNQEALQYGRQ
jgi:hypothetical protein